MKDLPEAVDLDELLRNALAEQRPGEDIDRSISRHIAANYPEAQQGLLEVVQTQLNEWQRARKISRQEAAEDLSRSQSELTMGPDGRSEVRTEMRSEMRIDGLEQLSPAMREMALKQIEQMMRTGGSGRPQMQGAIGEKRIGCGGVAVALMIAAAAVWLL